MISAAIICKNEENNIADCLESIKWADEIIVVDARSKDKTVELAKIYTNNIYIKEWEGYKKQREYALEKSNSEWIFVLDADERCTPELKAEILQKLRNVKDIAGYKIPRKSYFLNKWIKYSGWYPDYKLRLFRRDSVTVSDRLVHEGYAVEGKTAFLNNNIEHYTISSISDFANKINKYSSLEAEEKSQRKNAGFADFLFRPVSAFIRIFILKQGFRDGIHGLLVTYFDIITNILTYMKIWEIKTKRKNDGDL